MLTLNIFHTYFSVSIVDFEKVTVSWKEAFRIFFEVLQSEAKDLVKMYPGLLQTPKMEHLTTIITKCFILDVCRSLRTPLLGSTFSSSRSTAEVI